LLGAILVLDFAGASAAIDDAVSAVQPRIATTLKMLRVPIISSVIVSWKLPTRMKKSRALLGGPSVVYQGHPFYTLVFICQRQKFIFCAPLSENEVRSCRLPPE
jgi:hypothetical protein